MQSLLFFAKGVNGIPPGPASFSKRGAETLCALRASLSSPAHKAYRVRQLRINRAQLPLLRLDESRWMATVAVGLNEALDNEKGSCTSSPTMDNLQVPFPRVRRVANNSRLKELRTRQWQQQSISESQNGSDISRRRRKSLRLSPPASLALWLQSKSRPDRATQWARLDLFNDLSGSSLPTILLRYLQEMEKSDVHTDDLGATMDETTNLTLQRSGFSPKDVHLWAFILTAATDEEAAQRFLSSRSVKPTFVLLEILRRGRLSVRTFRSLLIHSWDYILDNAPRDLVSMAQVEAKNMAATDRASFAQALSPASARHATILQETTFTVLASRLLRHSRQVWAPAVVGISRMTALYCNRLARDVTPHGTDLHPRLHARLSRIYNKILLRLSLPASANPMKSMTYNWYAQRVLLESAATFRPPLQLDKNSYRAVSQVLVASKKSPREEKYTSLVQRPWPPWRREQDGMDVDRSPEDDISRVAAAVSRMREAGYEEDPIDKAIKILGGREPDGTPTIQTRYLTKVRTKPTHVLSKLSGSQDTRVEWASRIRATRDVREAWAAFLGFSASNQRPSPSMYHAMFEKLLFNPAENSRKLDYAALPGDGKEVMPVMDDNISESERLRLQPPTMDDLYTQMIRNGIRPSGRCLDLLVSQARTFGMAARYLRDSALEPTAVRNLLGYSTLDRSTLECIPDQTFAAFIQFLSQISRRYIPLSSANFLIGGSLGMKTRLYRRIVNPLLHAFELMRCRQSSSRFAWYALFSALARPGLMVDHRINQHLNDIMAWRLLAAAIGDSRKAGVELDPHGFQFICRGLEKALLASFHVSEDAAAPLQNGARIVKEAFSSLSESGEAVYGLPRLLHVIGGSHLHAYVRVLGLLHDTDEILFVLHWMIEHKEELNAAAQHAGNGSKLLQRSLVAMRAFVDHGDDVGEEAVGSLRVLMDQLEEWGGWPTDEEVDAYLTLSKHVLST